MSEETGVAMETIERGSEEEHRSPGELGTQPKPMAGQVDEPEFKSLVKSLEDMSQDYFSSYLTVREIAMITHVNIPRIYHALNHGKSRPLDGLKRGVQWFIRRDDALLWAKSVSEYEMHRWTLNTQRINRLIGGSAVKRAARVGFTTAVPTPERRPLAKDRDTTPRPKVWTKNLPVAPAGVRTYSLSEAAAVLQTTVATVSDYRQAGKPLGNVPNYQRDGERVLDADMVDDYAHSDRRRGHAPNRISEIPALTIVKSSSVA